MANIDNLNFKVILDDTGFQTQINKNIAEANRLNKALTQALNVKVSSKQIVTDKGLSNARQMSGILDEIAQKIRTMPKGKFLVGDADRLNATLEQTNKKLDQIIAKTQEAGKSATGLNRALLRFTATFWSIISIVRIFTRTFGAAIKNISSFQQANANLATIMQVSRKEIEVLTNDALMLGRTTEWTASQVTELQTALAKLGYNIPQIRNMQESVLQFATSVSADLTDAANLAGSALRMFGMHSTETQKALEILTASTNKTALDFEKLKVALPYAGAIAHSIGFDVAETASLLGVLANSGLAASRSGTGLRQILIELSQQNGKLQQAMGGNIHTFDDFVNGLQRLRDSGMEAGEAANLVQKRAAAALLILANGVDDIRRLNKEVRDTDGLLENIQKDRLNTLHGATLLLKSAWEGLIQTFRDSAGPMRDVVRLLTKIINATSLAASRANRVAQGTKHIVGSDALTEQWNDKFDSLLKSGRSPEEASKIVQEDMQKYLSGAYQTLAGWQQKGYKETALNDYLYKNAALHFLVSKKMKNGRIANEQVEAVENSIDAVNDYMKNRAAEEAEIAANAYLEEWKAVFDTKGEKAAREAMSKVAGFDDMKTRMEAYIANGGLEGAEDRGKGKDTKSADPLADARQQIRAEISLLEKLKSIYDRREAVFGKDAAASWVLENMGYNVKNLDADLESLIAKLRDLGDAESVAAAESIEASLGLDQTSKDIKAFNEAQKALEEYEKALAKFDKDWGTGETSGASYKAESVLKKYTNEKKKIEDDWVDLQKKAAAASREVTQAEIDLYEARKKANENTADEGIRGLVDDIVKGKFSGKELSDWSHKSLADIVGIKKAVEDMDIPEDIKQMILEKRGPEGLNELKKALEKYKKNLISGTVDPALFQKTAKYAKQVAKYISAAGDAMERLGAATSDTWLSDAGKAVSAIGQNLSAAAEGFEKSGSWIGAVVGGVVDIFNQVVDAAGKANEKMREMEEAVRNIRVESEALRFNNVLTDGVDGIFGENFVKRVQNAVRGINDLKTGLSALNDEQRKAFEWIKKVEIGPLTHGTAETIPNILAGLATPSVGDMNIRTDHSFWSGDTFKTLQAIADEWNMALTDDNDNLNSKLIDEVLKQYGDLNDGMKDWLTGAKQYSEEYAQAMEQIEEATKDVFDNLASDMADQFIDNFLAMGNAVDDLSDTFANLGDAILRYFLQSYILDEILGKYEEQARGALKKYSNKEMTPEEYAAWLDGFADTVQEESETLAPAINGMIEAFKDRGLMNIDENTANSLGSGIKSITEDTANLLASYINAIRADVSYIRMMQEKGWGAIENLGGALPTLQDYLAQIAATNYDTAQATNRILSELQSVIGAPGTSGMVVRVESA